MSSSLHLGACPSAARLAVPRSYSPHLLLHLSCRGRPFAFSSAPDGHLLYVGDYSSTVKVFDLRGGSAASLLLPLAAIPNSPSFCGDVCPVAALHCGGGVMASSSIGWWTANRCALEEAPEDEDDPVACLNFHRVTAAGGGEPSVAALRAHEYLYTLRLCPGIATCMAADSNRFLLGTSGGDVVGVSLMQGGGGRAVAVKAMPEGVTLEEGLPLGLEVLSDDEED